MQIHLASRVEDLYMAQKTTQALLETLVVEVGTFSLVSSILIVWM